MMKRHLFAAVAMLALAPAAFAADMPIKAPKAAAPANGVTGFYLGINGGMTAADQSYQFITAPGTSTSVGGPGGTLFPAGGIVGVTAGFGGALGAAYAAVEGDFDYDFNRAETSCTFAGISTRCGSKDSVLMTQRAVFGVPLSAITGAAGQFKLPTTLAPPSQWPVPINVPANFAIGNLMPFVTAGIAERNVSAFVDPTGIPVPAGSPKGTKEALYAGGSGTEWLVGYVVGGGLKMPISNGVTAGVEYDFIGFNKSFVPANATAGLFPTTANFKQTNEQRLLAKVDFGF
jgi:opacity protein-like surface antigen